MVLLQKEMNSALRLSELWELKASRMNVCNLTSLSPDGVEACGAVYIKELVQVAVCTFRQLQNQATVPRSFNVYDRGMSSAFGKGAQEVDFFKSREAFENSHKEHAKPQQDGVAVRTELAGGNGQLPKKLFQERVKGRNGSMRAHVSIDRYKARRRHVSKLAVPRKLCVPPHESRIDNTTG